MARSRCRSSLSLKRRSATTDAPRKRTTCLSWPLLVSPGLSLSLLASSLSLQSKLSGHDAQPRRPNALPIRLLCGRQFSRCIHAIVAISAASLIAVDVVITGDRRERTKRRSLLRCVALSVAVNVFSCGDGKSVWRSAYELMWHDTRTRRN